MRFQYVQRILIILLSAAIATTALVGTTRSYSALLRIILAAILAIAVVVLLIVFLDTASVPLRRRGGRRLGKFLSRILSPIYSASGRLLSLAGIPVFRIHRLFVGLNNRTVRQQAALLQRSSVIILLPFCLQGRRCAVTLERDASNCRVCGGCQIGELAELTREKGIDLRIASRSELAPALVRDTSADLAIAIACSEKLARGVIWTYYCPCYCVEAISDGQSCLQPVVDMPAVEEAVTFFMGDDSSPGGGN